MADKRTIEEWADDKPEYEVTEQHSVACTCEYKPSRKCPIHGKPVKHKDNNPDCTCEWTEDGPNGGPGWHLDPACPVCSKQPESQQTVDEPDWSTFEETEGLEGWWVEVNRAILWLRDRFVKEGG
uniref:Uncharacterized protein n=1 Tax=viral metagenome TaxID=1070528 RepID=A0A6M3JLI0_9ZZZZ